MAVAHTPLHLQTVSAGTIRLIEKGLGAALQSVARRLRVADPYRSLVEGYENVRIGEAIR